MTDPQCCGVCPPIEDGGVDCTCENNPNCTQGERPMKALLANFMWKLQNWLHRRLER